MSRTKLIRACLLPLAAVALVAGCTPKDDGGNKAAGSSPTVTATSAAPASPTAAATSAAPNTKKVCAALTDSFVKGSQKIVDDSNKAIAEQWSLTRLNKQLRLDLTAIATDLKKHAATANDAKFRATVEGWSKTIAAGGKASDPADFMEDKLVKVGTQIDTTCKNA